MHAELSDQPEESSAKSQINLDMDHNHESRVLDLIMFPIVVNVLYQMFVFSEVALRTTEPEWREICRDPSTLYVGKLWVHSYKFILHLHILMQ